VIFKKNPTEVHRIGSAADTMASDFDTDFNDLAGIGRIGAR
jgi:hypothetical protein